MDWEILVSCPRSEVVSHDMEAISLQPSCAFPSIQERKNGEQIDVAGFLKNPPIRILAIIQIPALFGECENKLIVGWGMGGLTLESHPHANI